MEVRDVVSIVLTVLILSVLVGGILLGYLGLKRFAEASQAKAFSGLEIFLEPRPGLVAVVFHTYYGFLVYFTQTEYRFWAKPEEARIALWRLHRFNLIWGWFAAGALFIPLISIGNYWAQSRSIGRQIEGAQVREGSPD